MDYRFQIFSDVIRDGLGIELLGPDRTVLAEVFRCDADNTLKISLFAEDVPFIEVEDLILMARKELACFEDGAPLPAPVTLQSS